MNNNQLSNKTVWFFLIIVLLHGLYSITALIPFDCLLNGSPVYDDDYAMHLYHCLSAKETLLSFGKTWGYDPFLLAGYPAGILFAADNKAWELLFYVLTFFISDGYAFNFYIILFFLAYPFLVYGAAKNFDLSEKEALISIVFSILVFYLTTAIDFVSWGMISFVFASYFAIYVFSVFYKWLSTSRIKYYLILLIIAPLLMLMHLISPVLVLIPSLIMYLLFIRKLEFKQHFMLFALLALVLFLNSFWLLPIAEFYHQMTYYIYMGDFTPLQSYSLLGPIKVYLLQYMLFPFRPSAELNNTFIASILLLFAAAGFYITIKQQNKNRLYFSILSGILFLFFISYYGSRVEFFEKLQPMRFLIPLNIFLIIPASRGLYYFVQKIIDGKSFKFKMFIVCFSFVVIAVPVLKQLKTIYREKVYRLSCSFPETIDDVFEWVKTNTDNKGRILLEDSEFDSGHQYYGTHLPALFPHYTQREYLSGPRPYPPFYQGVASFTSGTLFNREIESFSLKELEDYCDLYNIKWVICWSEETIKHFEKYPSFFINKTVINKFYMYEIKREASFFLKGSGEVKSEVNRLQLNNVEAEEGEIIIKYHWMNNFKTNPPLQIEEFPVLENPLGFIKVLNPPSSFEILLDY